MRTLFEIVRRTLQPIRVVVEQPDSAIAPLAEQTTNAASGVAMVNVEQRTTTAWFYGQANGAASTLLHPQHVVVFWGHAVLTKLALANSFRVALRPSARVSAMAFSILCAPISRACSHRVGVRVVTAFQSLRYFLALLRVPFAGARLQRFGVLRVVPTHPALVSAGVLVGPTRAEW